LDGGVTGGLAEARQVGPPGPTEGGIAFLSDRASMSRPALLNPPCAVVGRLVRDIAGIGALNVKVVGPVASEDQYFPLHR